MNTAGTIGTSPGTYQQKVGLAVLSTALIITGSQVTVSTDATMADNSDLEVPSQKAVKTYVDNKAGWQYISSASMTPGASGTITIPAGANFAILVYSASASQSGYNPSFSGTTIIAKTGATSINVYDGQGQSGYTQQGFSGSFSWSTSISVSFSSSWTNTSGNCTAYFYK